jgi:hypothetical protein
MPFVFSHVEYCDMHFVYGFCDGNARAAVDYQRRFQLLSVILFTDEASFTRDVNAIPVTV